MPSNDRLARDIFGGSDSELSSDEDEVPEVNDQHQAGGSGAYDDEVSGGDSEDEYQEKSASSRKKKPGKTRQRRADAEGEEGGKTRKRKRTSTATKKKKSAYEDIDLNELPPEQASKIRMEMRIEAALKTKRSSRPKKRKNNDEVLDSFADDEVARLRETMNTLAEEDIRSNQEKSPATAKLRFLGEAMETLRKASLAQSIIDNNLLDAVRRWLEPLPDRSLPALNIQRDLFAILRKMEFIDSAVLKDASLGPLVLFYTKSKRVTPDVQRVASDLVSAWSRPIIKRSASYRDRVVPVINSMDVDDGGPGSQSQSQSQYRPERLNAIMARAKEEEKHKVRKNAVSIPQSSLGTYTIAPRANAGFSKSNVSVDNDVERRKKNAERLRSLTRKVTGK